MFNWIPCQKSTKVFPLGTTLRRENFLSKKNVFPSLSRHPPKSKSSCIFWRNRKKRLSVKSISWISNSIKTWKNSRNARPRRAVSRFSQTLCFSTRRFSTTNEKLRFKTNKSVREIARVWRSYKKSSNIREKSSGKRRRCLETLKSRGVCSCRKFKRLRNVTSSSL